MLCSVIWSWISTSESTTNTKLVHPSKSLINTLPVAFGPKFKYEDVFSYNDASWLFSSEFVSGVPDKIDVR